MKVWICAVAKMEELYIREWIDWHKYLGIDHIIIGDNNDSNYNEKLQPIIQDYIDTGYVELINQNDVIHVQQPFYNTIYQKYKKEFDWITFIDIDEFIDLPMYDNNVKLFLSDKKFNDIDAIILPWLNFNDNDKLYYEDLPVRERFTSTIIKDNVGIKYFIRSLDNLYKIISMHHPISNKFNNNYQIRYCDCLGNKDIEVINDTDFTRIKVKNEFYDNAYISHYLFKSTEEYIKYKILRGRCDRKIGKYDARYTIQFYFNNNSFNKQKQYLFEIYLEKINDEVKKQFQKYKTNINGKNKI